MEDKILEYTKNGIIVRYKQYPFAIVVITPIMQRAHGLPFAKDIAFVDSTASCDANGHSVTIMLTACGIGAVPLALMITIVLLSFIKDSQLKVTLLPLHY